MGNRDAILNVLPSGQRMAKANQLAVEVQFIPLPTKESEERSERLGALLLRGALQIAQRQFPVKSKAEPLPLEPVEK